jgi:intracellular septation protein A
MRFPPRVLLLQLLPILIFLLVDALVQDGRWAIGAALLFVLWQAIASYRRERRLDPFVLLDALLIGGMGAVSLVTRNDFFFKLKPAIIEAVMVPYLLFLALSGEKMLLGYLGRTSAGVAIQPSALPTLRRLLGVMAGFVALHTGLVVFAAHRCSRQTWGWISGPGFYLILLPLAGWALFRRFKQRREKAGP